MMYYFALETLKEENLVQDERQIMMAIFIVNGSSQNISRSTKEKGENFKRH